MSQSIGFHPLGDLFPLLEGGRLDELADDIKAHGLREPIILYQGKVLDGRNRYRACERAGVVPRFEDLPDDADPAAFVVSKNLRRRHLDESQRAMVGAKLKEVLAEQAQRRQAHGLTAPGKTHRANLRDASKASEQAADLVNVSARSIDNAAKVRKNGVAGLGQLVEKGELAVSAAAEVANLPSDQQQQVVEDMKAGAKVKTAVARVVQKPAVLDGLRREVPEELHTVFQQVKAFQEVERILSEARRKAEELGKLEAGSYLAGVTLQQVVADLNNAKRAIHHSRPFTVCPYCHARKSECQGCKGRGWVRKETYRAAPEELKE